MIDKKKVIKGLECCRNLNPPDDWDCPEECPYSIESNPHRCCTFNPLLDDAIALFLEQEPVEPDGENCGECGYTLHRINYDGPDRGLRHEWFRFCPACGKAVKWDA